MKVNRLMPAYFLSLLVALQSAAQSGGVPASHLAHLNRGINIGRFEDGNLDNPGLSGCAANADSSLKCDYSIDRVAGLKVDHVRVLISPAKMFNPGVPTILDEHSAALANLDRLVQQILNKKMGLILALSLSEDQFKNRLGSDPQFLEQLKTFWRELARHYSDSAYSEFVFFEILNEPGLDEPLTIEQWSGAKSPPGGGILAGLAHAIRAGAPDSTILAPGGEKSDLNGLLALTPLPDIDNVVYVIHYYEPFAFTHQGANWVGSNFAAQVTGVPYPYAADSAERAANQVKGLVDKMNAWHDMETATRDRFNTDFEIAAEWARQNGNVPVICDEFGVYNKFSSPHDRVAWVKDVRTLLEKKNIRWTFWDYSSPSFGLVDNNGQADKDVVQALGLQPASN